jgi:aldehyde:ferredoxin oxidoreductase
MLLDEERWRQILSSLVVCFFARGIFTPDIVSKALQVVGFDFQPEDLHKIGEEIHREKYKFKIREGFSLDALHVPKRIFETPSPVSNFDEKFILDAIAYVKKELLLE